MFSVLGVEFCESKGCLEFDEGTLRNMSRRFKLWVVLLCVLAATGSLWLSVQKWTGQIDSLAGCGSGSGCSNVLGSKWSLVFGVIPVSVFSFLLYVSVLLSLIKVAGRWGSFGVWWRRLAAWLCLWAAVWFTGLQLVELKTICPYCMTMHGVGVLLGLSLLWGEKWSFRERGAIGVMCGAAVCVMGLAGVQYFGPDPLTYREDVLSMTQDQGKKKRDVHALGAGRLVSFLSGSKAYRVESLPHLGRGDAPCVMVEYFDYTCEACRETHRLLEDAVARYPDRLVVVVLPIPLERSCNPYLPKGIPDHESACKLARLSLVVWRADPKKFAEFHENLFEMQGMPYELAESLAVGLIGEDALSSRENQDWADAVLAQNVADYQWLIKKTPVLPKLLMGGSVVIQGEVNDSRSLQALLEKHFGLR